jgi:2-polyprenyl-3-methyl-5-hydroxy-6-metoxy-1,4-benzoquinol methylase
VQDAAVYQQLYDNAATSSWPADIARPDWDLITQHIFEQRPQGGHVLDFGCYTGGLLSRLGSAYRPYGVEINRTAAAVASKNTGSCVWSSVDDIPEDLRFDVVIASDVIEHMTNPMDLIDTLTSLLTDHGILIITTGDADNYLWNRFGANWWYCFYTEHVAFLSKAWLNYLSEAAGLSVVRCDTFRYWNPGHARRFCDVIFSYCYGWFPAAYLLVGGFLKRMLGHAGMSSVPGNGVSRDHLFIVLTKMDKL